jgi:hypothetical protein
MRWCFKDLFCLADVLNLILFRHLQNDLGFSQVSRNSLTVLFYNNSILKPPKLYNTFSKATWDLQIPALKSPGSFPEKLFVAHEWL